MTKVSLYNNLVIAQAIKLLYNKVLKKTLVANQKRSSVSAVFIQHIQSFIEVLGGKEASSVYITTVVGHHCY